MLNLFNHGKTQYKDSSASSVMFGSFLKSYVIF